MAMAKSGITGILVLLFLFGLAVFALFIVVLMGQYYLTALSFGHSTSGKARTYELESWQVTMIQIAVVIFWISLGLNLIYGVYIWNRKSAESGGYYGSGGAYDIDGRDYNGEFQPLIPRRSNSYRISSDSSELP